MFFLILCASVLPNAGVQRRRTAPNEGRPLASPSPAQNILTDFSFPVSDDSKLVASGMTERGAGAVRCNDLFDDAAEPKRSKLELIDLNRQFYQIEAPHAEPERIFAQKEPC